MSALDIRFSSSAAASFNGQINPAFTAATIEDHGDVAELTDIAAQFGLIAIVEGRTFLRECIRRGMQAAFPMVLEPYASVEELERDGRASSIRLVVLAWSGSDERAREENANSILRLSALFPGRPVVVLASRQNPDSARTALEAGAKGYIPMSMGFDIAVEAVRFVLAGGTYVPAEFLLSGAVAAAALAASPVDAGAMTAREMLVVRAIQQGKPNKIIAYELNMCESTVKVHVRHIMKKLGAKNRTAVAMKANEFAGIARLAAARR